MPPAAQSAPAAAAPVVVFTTPGCPYCKRAKEALRGRGVAYTEVDVGADAALRATLAEATGRRTVPQIYAKGAYIGGSDDLQAAIDGGGLDAALARGGAAALPDSLRDAVERAAAKAPAAGSDAPALPSDLAALATALADGATGVLASQGAGADKAFAGAALLAWLQKRGGGGGGGGGGASSGGGSSGGAAAALSVAEAEALGARLLAANVVTLVAPSQPPCEAAASVRGDARYRLRSDAPRRVAWGQALNTQYWWGPSPARPAPAVAADLRARIVALYDRHLSADGRTVAYGAMRRDPAFWAYVDATAELQRVELSSLSRGELTAFAINTYNALIIHTLVVHGTARYGTAAGRMSFFQKAARYNIGGSEYAADDLENGILRGNRPAASSLGMIIGYPCISRGPFGAADPRRGAVVPGPVDARIHFALVCGAASCPPIKTYAPDTLEEGLAAAAEAFCAGEVKVDAAARRVTLSKIFKWYSPDFGASKAERLAFLLPHLAEGPRAELQRLLDADPSAASIAVAYPEYSWELNGTD